MTQRGRRANERMPALPAEVHQAFVIDLSGGSGELNTGGDWFAELVSLRQEDETM